MKRNTLKTKYSKHKVNNKMNNNKNQNRNKSRVQILSSLYIIQKAKYPTVKRNKQKIYATCIAKEYYNNNKRIKVGITQANTTKRFIKTEAKTITETKRK